MPYVTELQSKLNQTRESLIRLEEQTHAQQEKIEQIQKTLDAIRNRLEAKGIVNRVIADSSQLSGERYVEEK